MPLSDAIRNPRHRWLVYTTLGWIVAVSSVIVSAVSDGFQPDDIPAILAGAASAAGFKLAASNTPR